MLALKSFVLLHAGIISCFANNPNQINCVSIHILHRVPCLFVFYYQGCLLNTILCPVSFLEGTGRSCFCAVPQRFLPAHTGAGPGRPPLSPPAWYHGWFGHRAPPAWVLCPTTLPANRGVPAGQPPMFTCSPGTGKYCQVNKQIMYQDWLYHNLLCRPKKKSYITSYKDSYLLFLTYCCGLHVL